MSGPRVALQESSEIRAARGSAFFLVSSSPRRVSDLYNERDRPPGAQTGRGGASGLAGGRAARAALSAGSAEQAFIPGDRRSEIPGHARRLRSVSRAAAGASGGSKGGRLAGQPFVLPWREPSQATWFGSYPKAGLVCRPDGLAVLLTADTLRPTTANFFADCVPCRPSQTNPSRNCCGPPTNHSGTGTLAVSAA